ncbi:MAG: DUF262 domain-containing protein [Candidatus Omnitrophica bacterium]|nr:DUF262 domain-containing protein [Candidatus Omnitrophota bacterium]
MKANAIPVLAIFEKKIRLEVPLFQRQYVWDEARQWEPLWEDISRKFTEYIEGRKEGPVHFLGAMVLDQKQTPITHVERRQIIDGQQRLTTLQIFLSALRDFCHEQGLDDLAKECDSFTLNKGMMADPEVDKFKVWPTQLDRVDFSNVMTSGALHDLMKLYPLKYRPHKRKPEPRPRIVEAYIFFYNQFSDYFLGTASETPCGGDSPLANRLDECLQALKNSLHVVVVDLDQEDDAQVIFETLNARGEPLLPADLLRNFIFLRAARNGESPEDLYKEYWQRFDDLFWRHEVSQGRLMRPRSDLFMQHFLSSRRAVDIPIKHLFVEYKWWIDRQRPFKTIREELAALARQGDDFRRIIEPKKDDSIFSFLSFLKSFDNSTVYPLILFLLDSGMPVVELQRISVIIESYLFRRAVCGFTAKRYNRIFLSMIVYLKEKGTTFENAHKYLSELFGESGEWPKDDAFHEAWKSHEAYHLFTNEKLTHILQRLNASFITDKTEKITIDSPLSVEHILPQNWTENWPLPDGSKGMTQAELWASQPEEGIAIATRNRNSLLHTFGNLTILTQPLNSSISNSAWEIKKSELLKSSLLSINQQLLYSVNMWDEKAIEFRSEELFKRAALIWPRPKDVI